MTGAPALATTFDTSLVSPPGVYFGTGNAGTNEHWTTNTQGTVEDGLTVIQRGVGATYTPTGNTYNVPTGADPTNAARAVWNFDFSINARDTGVGNSSLTLNDLTVTLNILNVGNSQTVSLNPLVAFGNDNSAYGTNGVTRNGNVSGQQATSADAGAQNSENFTFAQFLPLGFDMNADDTYVLTMLITGPNELSVSDTINVVVGNGAAETPLPAALPLFATGLGVFGLIAAGSKRKRQKVSA